MAVKDIRNYRKVNDLIASGGQPTEEQLAGAAAEGFRVVINLAPYDPARSLPDEQGSVAALGMTYRLIPVAWDDPRREELLEFDRLMIESRGRKVLVHCMANYRVSVFLALHAMKYWGWSRRAAEESIASIFRLGDHPVWEEFFRREAAERDSNPASG